MANSAFSSQVANLDISLKINQNGSQIYAAASGTTDNNYEISLNPPLSAYTVGMVVNFEADVANTTDTGKPTLNIDGVGAAQIRKNYGVSLVSDDIKASQIVTVVWDGTYWQMQSQLGNPSSGGGGSGTVIQTVNLVDVTPRSTTSGTFVTSGISLAITPTSASNDVRVQLAVYVGNSSATLSSVSVTIYRGATPLTPMGASTLASSRIDNNFVNPVNVIDFIDSPATTSPTTYTIYFATNAATGYLGRPGNTAIVYPTFFTLQELS